MTERPEASGGRRRARADVPAWRPFPLDALPTPVERYVKAAADSIGCDPAFVGLPVLAAIAGAVGATTRVQLKSDWREPCVVWAVMVGDSGTHKTPALKAATVFADEQDAREVRAFREELAGYKLDHQRYEAELRLWQKKPVGLPPTEPAAPVCRRRLVSDMTVEALADRLADNPRGLLVARDELGGVAGLVQPVQGRTCGRMLRFAVGEGREMVLVERPSVR